MVKPQKSKVPECWTTDLDGKPICGALKKDGSKAEWDEIKWIDYYNPNGYTPQEFKDQRPEDFKRMICHNKPSSDPNYSMSGRCRNHGAHGGRPVSDKMAKYSKLRQYTSPGRLEEIFESDNDHNNLQAELDIMTAIIDEKLPAALSDTASAANENLRGLIHQLKEAFTSLNPEKINAIIEKMEAMIDDNLKSKTAQKETVSLLAEYTNMVRANHEIKQKSEAHFSKSALVVNTVLIVNLVKEFLNDAQRQLLNRRLENAIENGRLGGFIPEEYRNDSVVRPFDSRQEQENNSVIIESSPAALPRPESESTII
jgi:hypothetical protein